MHSITIHFYPHNRIAPWEVEVLENFVGEMDVLEGHDDPLFKLHGSSFQSNHDALAAVREVQAYEFKQATRTATISVRLDLEVDIPPNASPDTAATDVAAWANRISEPLKHTDAWRLLDTYVSVESLTI